MKCTAHSRGQRLGLKHLGLAIALILSACAGVDEHAQNEAAVTALRGDVKDKVLSDAEQALAAGDIAMARDGFGRVLVLDPENVRARFGLAEVNLASRQPFQAAAIYDDLVSEPDVAAEALQGKGISLAMMRKTAEAKKSLTEAVRMDPSLWRAWNALGQIYDSERRWEDAQKSYKAALKANSQSQTVYNNIGVSFLMQKRYEDAVQAFRQALKLRPDLKIARSNLRLTLAWEGKYDKALAGTGRDERPAVLNNLGYIAILRGDYGVAESLLSQAMAESPSYFETAAKNLEYLRAVEAGGGAAEQGGLVK